MRAEVLADAEAAARRGAEVIAAAASESIDARGGFSLAVSGGHGPWRMFELLDAHDLAAAREIADKLLANPVIEDFTVRVDESAEQPA